MNPTPVAGAGSQVTKSSISPDSDDHSKFRPDIVAMLLRAAEVRAAAAVANGKVPVADYDDIRQEIAIELWLSLPNYDASRASIRTFLERIADWRSPSVILRHRDNVIVEQLAGHQFATANGIPAVEVQLDFDRILSSLEEDDRDIAQLLVEHGPTEISAMLGIARSTVYRRRRRLRQVFRMSGYEPVRREAAV